MVLVDSYHGFLRIAGQLDTPCNDRNLVAKEAGQQIAMYAYIEVYKGFYFILVHDSYLRDSCLEHLGQSGEVTTIIARCRIYTAALFGCG